LPAAFTPKSTSLRCRFDLAERGNEKAPGLGHRNGPRTVEGLQEAQIAEDVTMPLTREFKETVQARIKQDRKYRKELLREGVDWASACITARDDHCSRPTPSLHAVAARVKVSSARW
jgi:hypothetical protein